MIRISRAFPALLAALLVGACHYGTRPRDFRPALLPVGAHVAVRIAGDSADRLGELYAVDSIGVTVFSGSLFRVSWARLFALDVDKMGRSVDIFPREVVTAEKRRRVAAVSRFPQGLTPDLLKAVLQRLRQDSLVEIARADLDSLARLADAASRRYADRRVAIAEGYRRIGADFPGMGEHWVNPNRIQTRDHVDATKPSFLSYAVLQGQPRLLGAGFIVTTTPDTGAVHLPGWPDAWHEHSGLLGDESAGRQANTQPKHESRVFVLHIWSALENPDGRYAPDNWTLPFARANRAAPTGIDADAGRAFSLSVGGDEFLRATLVDLGLRPDTAAAAVDSAIARARSAVVSILTNNVSFRTTNGREESAVHELRAIWTELDATLRQLLGPSVADVMRPAHRLASSPDHRHLHGTPR